MASAILLSGGVDSVALTYWKRPDTAFVIDYGQVSFGGELRAARQIALELQVPIETITTDCKALGSGDLAGMKAISFAPAREWWPFRNQLLLTLAGMKAINMGITNLMFGSVKTDSFHRDGTEEFFFRINRLFEFQEGNLTVAAPAIGLTSVELVRQSRIPRSLLAWSHSCHVSDIACGHCRGCIKHYTVMRDLGYEDD